MWNFRSCCALILLTVSFITGCSTGAGAPKQTPALDTPNWPELKTLGSPEITKGIYFARDKKDESALKKALTSAGFVEAVDKFAKSKIPSGYDSAERKAAQEAVVAKYRKAIELAKSGGSFKDLSENYEAGSKAYHEAGAPKGGTPKVEAPKAGAPKAEAPKADAPSTKK